MDKKFHDQLIVSNAPHLVTKMDTQKTMLMVILALVPAGIVSTFIFGLRVLLLVAVCVACSMAFEALWNIAMKRKQTALDLSSALTGLLIAYNVPVTLPIWTAIVGCFVAIIIVKQLFGGIGKNITNPAITARVVLFISFATEMTSWSAPTILDGMTSATPLGILAEGGANLPGLKEMFLGFTAGSLGEVSAIALLVGGVFLVWKKIISPIIPCCFIGTVFVFALVYYGVTGGNAFEMAIWHVLAGGVMLGSIFMATDYVTSPLLPAGKVVFGVGCGLLTMIIRLFGQYPEGVSFSILIMNCLTPLIDSFFQKRMYGGAK